MRPLTPLLASFLLATAATSLDAQVIRLPRRSEQPSSWFALGFGWHEMNPVNDGGTGTIWDFGSALQYRASLESATSNQGAVGITVTYARVPMSHRGDPACGGGACDAHGDVWQLLGTLRMGGGEGFHQVIELGLGVTHYSNFRTDDADEKLAPLEGDNDFTLAVSYGFGFGFSPRSQIFLVQDFATMWHQRHGLSGNASNFVQQRSTRIGFRYGLGSRTTR